MLRTSLSMLTMGLVLCLATRSHAQNPPMNCTPDGIIEVCTTVEPMPVPGTPDPAPSAAPTPMVTYKDGQLMISAENVSLSDVLHEVSVKTGATIEFPAGSASEPVFTNIGPGPVRNILATLLNGTKFNYVMLGSATSSDSLEKVVLTQGDQPTEVADSTAPGGTSQFPFSSRQSRKTLQAAGPDQTPEEKRAQFMQEVETLKAARMQELQTKYADMAAKGLLRTPAGSSDSTSSSSSAADSSAAESPAPDPPNQ